MTLTSLPIHNQQSCHCSLQLLVAAVARTGCGRNSTAGKNISSQRKLQHDHAAGGMLLRFNSSDKVLVLTSWQLCFVDCYMQRSIRRTLAAHRLPLVDSSPVDCNIKSYLAVSARHGQHAAAHYCCTMLTRADCIAASALSHQPLLAVCKPCYYRGSASGAGLTSTRQNGSCWQRGQRV